MEEQGNTPKIAGKRGKREENASPTRYSPLFYALPPISLSFSLLFAGNFARFSDTTVKFSDVSWTKLQRIRENTASVILREIVATRSARGKCVLSQCLILIEESEINALASFIHAPLQLKTLSGN